MLWRKLREFILLFGGGYDPKSVSPFCGVWTSFITTGDQEGKAYE